jgi:probable DNA repair protein
VLTRVLEPMRPLGADAARPFNISLGAPLDQWPIAHDALAVLRLAGRAIPYEEASAALRSPFLAGAQGERAARDALDAAMRRRAFAEVTLDGLLRLARRPGMPAAPGLVAVLERLDAYRRSDLHQRRGAAEWARAIEAALRHAGFPGERTLDSAEFQAWAKWHDALAEFAGLEQVMGAMSWGEACRRLARIAASTLFQPETPDVPIQVLGLLEATGLDFDALWVMGLSEDAWPMPPRPNAFLPLALQRAAGIPHADAAASLALDERITAAWKRSAGQIVFSHARMREDSEIGASPLVSDIPEADPASLAVWQVPAARDAMKRRGSLQRIADGRGRPASPDLQPGGTRLFRDQAACPFRAFAIHRLASKPLERPEPGLDPKARGTLLHEMLANVWRELRDKARLDALSIEERDAMLARAADGALETCGKSLGDALAGRFRALERERLIGTTREWLELERARDFFEVVEVEEKREMTFGGVTVRVKLDRMDALRQGGRAVIDYKTGPVAVSSWLGPRPDEPQVPMYTLGSGEDVRAVAFARLKRGDLGYCGFAMAEGLLPKAGLVQDSKSQGAKEYRDWTAMIAGWREKLDALGREFAQGEARVDPKAASACEQCDQHAFCRIAEKRDG